MSRLNASHAQVKGEDTINRIFYREANLQRYTLSIANRHHALDHAGNSSWAKSKRRNSYVMYLYNTLRVCIIYMCLNRRTTCLTLYQYQKPFESLLLDWQKLRLCSRKYGSVDCRRHMEQLRWLNRVARMCELRQNMEFNSRNLVSANVV